MQAIGATVAAVVAAAILGLAIQRGGTCTVAAVREMVEERRVRRLLSLVEAAVWVSGGLILLRALGLGAASPAGHALGWATMAGGVLLGVGAYLAGACLLGSIARLGAGDWAFLAVPPGYFIGCLVSARLGLGSAPAVGGGMLAIVPVLVAVPVVIMGVLRVAGLARAGHLPARGRAWHPNTATIVIALAIVMLMILVGPWAWTDALAGLARGQNGGGGTQLLLFAALLGGAVIGGWGAGLPTRRLPTPRAVLRCLGGGAVMAMGAALVPGGNDGLVLIGLPHFQAHAWAAFAAMVVTVAALLLVERRLWGASSA